MKNRLPFLLCVAATGAVLFFSTSCEFSLLKDTHSSRLGSLLVKITDSASVPSSESQSSSGRTILPVAVTSDTLVYDLSLISAAGYSPISAIDRSLAQLSLSGIPTGVWTLKISAKLTAGGALAFEREDSITIVAGPNAINWTLEPLASGNGSLNVTITWPTLESISTVNAWWSTDSGDFKQSALTAETSSIVNSGINSGIVISKSAIPAGTYYLNVELNKNPGTSIPAAVVRELVRIYPNRDSAATIALDAEEISKPPRAPTDFSITARTDTTITFQWTDNSNTETSVDFADDSDWTDIGAGINEITVPAPLSDTTYIIRMTNAFGDSEATYNFRPARVLYNDNSSTGGSSPVDPWVYEIGGKITAPAPINGTLAKTGFTFGGWYKDNLCTLPWSFANDALNANSTTLWAKWVAPSAAVTISLDDPSESTVTFDSPLTLNRFKSESIQITATISGPEPVTEIAWSISGMDVKPVLGSSISNPATISTEYGATGIGVYTVTLFYAKSGHKYSKRFSLRVTEESDMIFVPGGSFQRDESAENISAVSPFWMGATEVTQAEYNVMMGVNPSSAAGPGKLSHPVETVSWYDAILYCNLRSMVEGLTPVYIINGYTNPSMWGYSGNAPTVNSVNWNIALMDRNANGYRLPTQNEWLWAAMGATSDASGYTGGINSNGYSKPFAGFRDNNTYPGEYAWIAPGASGVTHPVGTKLANELGLFDMSGNVFEWCWETKESWTPTGPYIDYAGRQSTNPTRKIVGGNFGETNVNLVNVFEWDAFGKSASIGFRVVRSAQEKGYVPTIQLLRHFPFNGNMNDMASATSGTGITVGMAPTNTANRKGYPDSAIALVPSGYLTVTDSVFNCNHTDSFTISIWFKTERVPGTPGTRNDIVVNGGSPGTFQWGLILLGDNKGLYASVGKNSAVGSLADVTAPIAPKYWQHAVLTYNGVTENIQLYLNGAYVGMNTFVSATYDPSGPANTPLRIGGSNFEGFIDDLRLYNRVLSAGEIKALSNE